jgi:hypothetical protein
VKLYYMQKTNFASYVAEAGLLIISTLPSSLLVTVQQFHRNSGRQWRSEAARAKGQHLHLTCQTVHNRQTVHNAPPHGQLEIDSKFKVPAERGQAKCIEVGTWMVVHVGPSGKYQAQPMMPSP